MHDQPRCADELASVLRCAGCLLICALVSWSGPSLCSRVDHRAARVSVQKSAAPFGQGQKRRLSIAIQVACQGQVASFCVLKKGNGVLSPVDGGWLRLYAGRRRFHHQTSYCRCNQSRYCLRILHRLKQVSTLVALLSVQFFRRIHKNAGFLGGKLN